LIKIAQSVLREFGFRIASGARMAGTWKFRVRGRGEVNHDPVEGEFFTPDGLSGSLVREAVQNSLDAKTDGSIEPVQVRFALSKSQPSESLQAAISERYTLGLSPHLDAFSISNFPRLQSDPFDYLVVEDFGTRGLNGDPRQESDDDDLTAPKNDFYYFWRNVGRSRKGETDRGRWGLGKTVFPASSRINSFFGLTVRQDGRRLLMGESVLKIHKAQDGAGRHDPYGFFGSFDNDLPMPVEDSTFIAKFCEDFRLKRAEQPGLSIVVPFPRRDEINISEIVRSAIVHYFYPIITGRLKIRVEGDGTNLVLDSVTIETATRELDWTGSGNNRDKLLHLFDLSRWAMSRSSDSFVALRSPGQESAVPKWEEAIFPPETLSTLRRQFDAGERIALLVPVSVERKNQLIQQSYFSVFVMRDSRIDKGEDHYIRQGITVSKINMLQNKGARGLVVIDDKALTTLLGDAENPAHTDWQERATRIRENYVSGASRIRFVKNSLRFIVDLLTQRTAGRDEDLLKDLFYVEIPPDEPTSPKPKQRKNQKGDSNDEVQDIPDPQFSAFTVQKVAGGFCITGNPEAPENIGSVRIEVAYEVRSGNAFRHYDLFDFELNRAPFRISAEGASYEAGRNCLQVAVQRKDFSIEVKGFDPKRNIRIKAVVERNPG
jgi:hypothetical protein